MGEMDDLERYFKTQFDQLEHICQSKSPWIFICLSVFIEYLANMVGADYINFIKKSFPLAYKEFKYSDGKSDLAEQIYLILRNGLVHSFSLTPNRNRESSGRKRSVYLIHREPDTKNLAPYTDASQGIDAATLVAEDFLEDTKAVAFKLIDKARKESDLEQHIIKFVIDTPPIAGIDQNYFWQKVVI